MVTAIISDLHLGAPMTVLGTPPVRERLLEELAGVDELILLGDLLSLRVRPADEVLEMAAPFLDGLRETMGGRRVVIVPGNHDHRLTEPLLARRRREPGTDRLSLEGPIEPADPGLAGELAARLTGVDLRIAYPGVWLRPDVYATHGHYLDCHMSVPRIESLCAAVLARATGGLPERSARPDDYEAVLAPLYAFAYSRAQLDRATPLDGTTAALWQSLKRYGWGRVRGDRGWRGAPARLLGDGVALTGAGVLRLAGIAQFRRDVSPAEIGRSGLRAAAQMIDRLDIGAEHVVFGHTHYAGPLNGDAGWTLPGGTRLYNCGSWAYEPELIGAGGAADPYWPGRAVFVGETGPPEVRLLLDEPAAWAR